MKKAARKTLPTLDLDRLQAAVGGDEEARGTGTTEEPMLSNIMKNQHQTAMAIVGNLR